MVALYRVYRVYIYIRPPPLTFFSTICWFLIGQKLKMCGENNSAPWTRMRSGSDFAAGKHRGRESKPSLS